jgi:hypothetical protein
MVYVAPIPIELPRASRGRRGARRAETAAIFTRHLAPVAASRVAGRTRPPDDIGRRLRRAFETLGSTYVKFGQLIGSSPGAFGQAVSDEFRSCLDAGPAVPFFQVRAAVEAMTGQPLAETFASFDEAPLAAASIAVVHRATLVDGHEVAVKVLRPGIAARVALDLDIMQPLFRRLALRGLPIGGPLYRFLGGFRTQVAEELDLANEARTMQHFRELFAAAGFDNIVVPLPVDGLVGRDVLVMDFLDGVPIDDVAAIDALGHDASPLLKDLLRSWFLTGLRDGMFHGDIHAGNLMLLRDGRMGMIDWGIVGRLDEPTRHLFRRFVEAVLGDASAWPEILAFMQEHGPFGAAAGGDGSTLEISDEDKDEIEGILTRPFGDVSLAGAFSGPGRLGEERRPLTRPERRERRSRIRELRQRVIGSGFADTQLAQANFMLFKQLLYFERYGKMYMSDTALMGDHDWLQKVLAESPPPSPAFTT